MLVYGYTAVQGCGQGYTAAQNCAKSKNKTVYKYKERNTQVNQNNSLKRNILQETRKVVTKAMLYYGCATVQGCVEAVQ